MSELFPVCFSCSNNFNLLHYSSRSDDKKIVEIPEVVIAGDLSNFVRVRSRVDFLPCPLSSKCNSFAKSYISFLSVKLARSTLEFLLVITFKNSPFNSNCLFVSRNVNKLLYKVIGTLLCISKSLIRYLS